jgi:hypothetical protein
MFIVTNIVHKYIKYVNSAVLISTPPSLSRLQWENYTVYILERYPWIWLKRLVHVGENYNITLLCAFVFDDCGVYFIKRNGLARSKCNVSE